MPQVFKGISMGLLLSSTIFGFSQETLNSSKINYYHEKANRYLDKNQALSANYAIEHSGISMYESAENKIKNLPEFVLKWEQLEKFKRFLKIWDNKTAFEVYQIGTFEDDSFPTPPPLPTMTDQLFKKETKILDNLKIALDPGHLAGDREVGILEKKFIHFNCQGLNGINRPIDISEGILTFATAKLLKEKLEAEGATVFMTRKTINGSAYDLSFENWLNKRNIDSLFSIGEIDRQQKKLLMDPKTSKRDKFRFVFRDLELRKRAEIINNFQPDFTIIIHYNVDETNLEWTKPTNKNFNMVFVGGAFMKDDLLLAEKRFEFLRMLISEDLEKSIELSEKMIASFKTILNVESAKLTDAAYLEENCLSTGTEGVYCRNLQLTRKIHSPLVYGETLYQDNIKECILLNEEEDKTKNKRVQQVAEAYFQGIISSILNLKTSNE